MNVSRANQIKAEQESYVASLTSVQIVDELRAKIMPIVTHKTEPSSMSIPVNYERDDDCYVSIRLNELRKRHGAIEMANITVKMKDGEIREFKHRGRPGGSYSPHVSYEGAMVVITDEWYKRIAIPAADVIEVIEEPLSF